MDPKEKKKSKCNSKVIYIEIAQRCSSLRLILKYMFSHVKALSTSHHIVLKMETTHTILKDQNKLFQYRILRPGKTISTDSSGYGWS